MNMTPFGAKALAIYSMLVVATFIVHNMVKVYMGKEEGYSLAKIILLVPMFIYFSNVICK